MIQIQDNISEQKNLKDKLESEQEKLHVEYNKVSILIQTHTKAGSSNMQVDCQHVCSKIIISKKFKRKNIIQATNHVKNQA